MPRRRVDSVLAPIIFSSYLMYVPRFLALACCTPFTAALASAMAEGDSSDDRGPAGSGGATWKYDSSDIKLGCISRKKML